MFANLDILGFIEQYGYIAIFLFVFFQELGIPTPVPNEIMLLFSGYLTSTGTLDFWFVFLVAILGDIIGTTALYLLFYFFSTHILEGWKKFINEEKLHKIRDSLEKRGKWGIFVGRFIPYIRGYTSLAAGLLGIHPHFFIPIVVIPAIIWAGGYVAMGHFLGQKWQGLLGVFNQYQTVFFTVGFVVMVIFIFKIFYKKGPKN